MSTTNELPAVAVARVYLEAEIGRLLGGRTLADTELAAIASLSDDETWRLLEALSYTYRLNGMFAYLSNEAYRWTEERRPASDLALTGVNPAVDAVVQSEAVGSRPLAFRDYLQAYFSEHPDDDPQGLGEFRSGPRDVGDPRLIVVEVEGRLNMLDGTHRLMQLLQQGAETLTVIRGTRGERPGLSRGGAAVIMALRELYRREADAEEQAAILTVTELLGRVRSDGRAIIRERWVEHAPDEQVRKAGRRLLEEQP